MFLVNSIELILIMTGNLFIKQWFKTVYIYEAGNKTKLISFSFLFIYCVQLFLCVFLSVSLFFFLILVETVWIFQVSVSHFSSLSLYCIKVTLKLFRFSEWLHMVFVSHVLKPYKGLKLNTLTSSRNNKRIFKKSNSIYFLLYFQLLMSHILVLVFNTL